MSRFLELKNSDGTKVYISLDHIQVMTEEYIRTHNGLMIDLEEGCLGLVVKTILDGDYATIIKVRESGVPA